MLDTACRDDSAEEAFILASRPKPARRNMVDTGGHLFCGLERIVLGVRAGGTQEEDDYSQKACSESESTSH
jgi:hypothetical protein